MASYRTILSFISDAELILRIDKKFNSENLIKEITRILDSNNLKFNKIEAKERNYSLAIYIDDKNLQDWVFENTKEQNEKY